MIRNGDAKCAQLQKGRISKLAAVNLWRRAQGSQFAQSVAVLSTGTLIAQVILISVSPVLTRLYTPADFGLAAIFAAVVGSLRPAICGKYEVAIVVSKTAAQGRQLLGVAFWVALSLSLVVFGAVCLFGDALIELVNANRLGDWILLVPLALFFAGVLAGLSYYSNSLLDYRIMSASKILAGLFGVLASVVFGLLGLDYGLLLSSILGTVAASLWLLYRYRRILDSGTLLWNRRKQVLFRRYLDFPIYNATSGLLDGVTLALPVFFLSRYFPEAVVGYYALMLRVAMAPLGFVSGAISQVHLKKVAGLVHHDQPIRPYLLKLTLTLIAIVSPLVLILMLFSPPIFAWVFGEEWRVGGTYLQILMPALALKFVVSTISSTFGATGHNRLGAVWKVTAFLVTLLVFSIFAPNVSVESMFYVILVTDLALYSFYYLLAWRAAGHPWSAR